MSWEAYRARILAANPRQADANLKMTLTCGEFLLQLEQAYRRGEADVRSELSVEEPSGSDMPEFLQDLFGKFPKGARQ